MVCGVRRQRKITDNITNNVTTQHRLISLPPLRILFSKQSSPNNRTLQDEGNNKGNNHVVHLCTNSLRVHTVLHIVQRSRGLYRT